MRRFACSRCADPGVHDRAISALASFLRLSTTFGGVHTTLSTTRVGVHRRHEVKDSSNALALLGSAHGAVVLVHPLGQVTADRASDDGLDAGRAGEVIERSPVQDTSEAAEVEGPLGLQAGVEK
jgi:hypothetical protein